MKPLIRLFFNAVRLIAGPVLLFTGWTTMPRGIVRSPVPPAGGRHGHAPVRALSVQDLPVLMKVWRTCKRLSHRIEVRDAQHDANARQELLQAAGKVLVPCLKIAAPMAE